ncbi:MAG: DnaJ domain-containing protein [Deltaproteobacteria bacterium]|nr:DnaJ domain-containing protein [Deltaproteobacteria bacterium]
MEVHFPHSQLACWKCRAAPSDLPVCSRCGAVQDFPDGLSHYETLGLGPSLALNEEELRNHYYALCRELHPDQHIDKESRQSIYSLRWTTAINKAYQILRDPIQRSQYVLQLHQVDTAQLKPALPFKLAETYLDLQSDGPMGKEIFEDFKKEMLAEIVKNEQQWDPIARQFDSGVDRPSVLRQLAQYMANQKILSAMANDLNKRWKE